MIKLQFIHPINSPSQKPFYQLNPTFTESQDPFSVK